MFGSLSSDPLSWDSFYSPEPTSQMNILWQNWNIEDMSITNACKNNATVRQLNCKEIEGLKKMINEWMKWKDKYNFRIE